jgi:hypothetical protein
MRFNNSVINAISIEIYFKPFVFSVGILETDDTCDSLIGFFITRKFGAIYFLWHEFAIWGDM